MKIHVATHNKHKLSEIAAILPAGVELLPDDPAVEETESTFEGNALLKARAVARRHPGEWTLADDSGLETRALCGAPGVHSARFAGEPVSTARNNAKLLAELADAQDRRARFRCCVALVDPEGREHLAQGVCEGRIIEAPQGGEGFGYDPLFVPDGRDKTFAALSGAEKNAISHRGAALRAARKIIGI